MKRVWINLLTLCLLFLDSAGNSSESISRESCHCAMRRAVNHCHYILFESIGIRFAGGTAAVRTLHLGAIRCASADVLHCWQPPCSAMFMIKTFLFLFIYPFVRSNGLAIKMCCWFVVRIKLQTEDSIRTDFSLSVRSMFSQCESTQDGNRSRWNFTISRTDPLESFLISFVRVGTGKFLSERTVSNTMQRGRNLVCECNHFHLKQCNKL